MRNRVALAAIIAMLAFSVTFVAQSTAPTLTSMNVISGVQGASVPLTLTGTNFVAGQTSLAISGTGVYAAGIRVTGPTTLTTLLVLSGAPGTRDIRVVNSAGSSAPLTFTTSPSPFAAANQFSSTTLMGNTTGIGSSDGARTAARFFYPNAIWGDATNLYIVDSGNGTIRKMNSNGQISTLAGTVGIRGIADGIGAAAQFGMPSGIWGTSTYLYVSDSLSLTIRQIDPITGRVSTLAGAAGSTSTLVDGLGTEARFVGPQYMWGDGTNLFVADSNGSVRAIRKIVLASGQVSTVADLGPVTGNDSTTVGLWGDGTNLWIADSGLHSIRRLVIATGQITDFVGQSRFSGSSDGSGSSARFNRPIGITGTSTTLYVSDSGNHLIRKILISSGAVTTEGGFSGLSGALDGIGNAARFFSPAGLFATEASVYVADYGNHMIRKVEACTGCTGSSVSTYAGSARVFGSSNVGPVQFRLPYSVWGDGTNLYISDSINFTIRQVVLATTQTTTVAGSAGVAGIANAIGTAARFFITYGLGGDLNNLYITEYLDTIRRMQLADRAVVAVAGNPSVPSGNSDGVGSAARFRLPTSVWSDGSNLYVADSLNYTIRRIVIATSQVTTFAGDAGARGTADGVASSARFYSPVEVWGDGTFLYVIDGGSIRRVEISTGRVTTIAGSPTVRGHRDGNPSQAMFAAPTGLWSDGSYLYIADNFNNVIRRMGLPSGQVQTIAGVPRVADIVDGPGTTSRFVTPSDLWGDGTFLYVSDFDGNNIRRISAQPPAADAPGDLRFTIQNRGGVSRVTAGTNPSPNVGFGRIQASPGSTTPSGLAIFGFTQNGVLVTEAAVPASPLMNSGRVFAEIGSGVNTGVAIANPNAQPVTLTFYATASDGTNFNAGFTIIPANGQIAAFLDQSPFIASGTIPASLTNARTFTFNSSLPVSIVALRGRTNERGEFLLTTLPVTEINSTIQSPVIFPHFADGEGWTTQVNLVNQFDETLTGTIQFFSKGSATSPGQATAITANGTTATSFDYTIAPRSSFKLITGGLDTIVNSGSVRVLPSGGMRAPSGLVVFSYKNAGVTVAESGVPALPSASTFRLYAEASGDFNAAAVGSIQTGFAIANPSFSPASVSFELTTLDGTSTGLTGSAVVPANGQIAMFLNQIDGFQNLPQSFRGLLRVSGSGISVVGLRGRYNQRQDFLITTTSPVDEAALLTGAEFVFPHLADGGGYTTQFILYSGFANQTSSGSVRFFGQTGQSLNLNLQ